jgi:hypothetical protein
MVASSGVDMGHEGIRIGRGSSAAGVSSRGVRPSGHLNHIIITTKMMEFS